MRLILRDDFSRIFAILYRRALTEDFFFFRLGFYTTLKSILMPALGSLTVKANTTKSTSASLSA